MSLTGVCDVCERAPATDTCTSCGSIVCRRHYVPARGACVSCAGEGVTGMR